MKAHISGTYSFKTDSILGEQKSFQNAVYLLREGSQILTRKAGITQAEEMFLGLAFCFIEPALNKGGCQDIYHSCLSASCPPPPGPFY